MKTASYIDRKSYVRYDNEYYLLYLNESPAEVLVNKNTGLTQSGFSYAGSEVDGSTKIKASNVTDDNRRGVFIAGLISLRYDINAQIAMLANNGDTAEHAAELARFNDYRAYCKAAIDELLSRTF